MMMSRWYNVRDEVTDSELSRQRDYALWRMTKRIFVEHII